jgi:type IV pilus biogenesis protein CpaD/CtpE
MQRARLTLICLSLAALSACADYEQSATPDYRIKVQETPRGLSAVAPECVSWRTASVRPWDNNPAPQLGCANARNLAAMVDQPRDLLQPRAISAVSGHKAASSIDRYYNEKTAPLIDAKEATPQQQNIAAPSSSGGGAPF